MNDTAPVTQDLVLLGGGHAHLFVLRSFGMQPVPGLRLTLISRDVHTPYSGMLPGFLAGHYAYDDAHIDLRPLAAFAGARLFHDEATGIDRAAKRVLCAGRPPVAYDLLSIDVGSRPAQSDVPGAAELAVPLKPIDRLAVRWDELLSRVRDAPLPFRLAVVGGGAAGVEVALAAQYRLGRLLAESGRDSNGLKVALVSAGGILEGHAPRVGRIFARVLASRGVEVHTDRRAVKVEPGVLHLSGGERVAFDEVLWATQAVAAPWLAASGLRCGPEGFVQVDATLRVQGEDAIFAAGDVADVVGRTRPKAGVFAVRQGPALAENLRAAAEGRPLAPFRPQKRFLSLVTTGDRYAVASKGPFAAEGGWVWRWKDRIDHRFVNMFRDLGAMGGPAEAARAHDEMRCGGCGAKVGSSVLSRVLARLEAENTAGASDVVVGLSAPDDAAVLRPVPGKLRVQTVDFFRSFLDDPYVFGRIAAVHALGDVHAMAAEPRTALAIATVPHGRDDKVEDALYQMMAGALSVFREEGVVLVGGHSSEAAENGLGFSVEGVVDEGSLLRKSTPAAGNALVLTKPIGTGVLFAADMRGRAKGRWIDAALASMQRSSRGAARALAEHGATACTDVTGFGLAGHLLEMLRPAGLAAELDLAAIPVLDGAAELAGEGIASSLHPANARAAAAIDADARTTAGPRYSLLFDPQTAGGLLAAVPADRAADCMTALHAAGDTAATVIGRVVPAGGSAELLRIGRDHFLSGAPASTS